MSSAAADSDLPPPLEAIPAPVPTTMSEKMAKHMEAPLRGFIRELPRVLQEVVGVKPGFVVADLGAGTGVVTEALARAVTAGGAKGGRVYSLDLTPFFLQGLRARKQRLEASDPAVGAAIEVQAISESGNDLGTGIPDGSLDLVFLADVFHHLSDSAATVRAAARALKPQTGRIVVLENDRAKYMESLARNDPNEFKTMLAANIKNRQAHGHGGGDAHGHGHGHSHGTAAEVAAQGHVHGHSHSGGDAGGHGHSHGHSHGGEPQGHSHGDAYAGTAGVAAASREPLDPSIANLSIEECVAMARKIVGSIPPEDPARITALMNQAGLTLHADLKPIVKLDDVDIMLAFIKQ